MFSVIISEKGGAERRETFDRTEINVGRVQGNDLMLPKGNVSKRHARLLHRDGRFIVTDLKSTNGTYVNGRKIAQATIVREGDKIYIGDFVLRIEAGGVALQTGGSTSAPPLLDEISSDVQSAPPALQPAQVAPQPGGHDGGRPPVAPGSAPKPQAPAGPQAPVAPMTGLATTAVAGVAPVMLPAAPSALRDDVSSPKGLVVPVHDGGSPGKPGSAPMPPAPRPPLAQAPSAGHPDVLAVKPNSIPADPPSSPSSAAEKALRPPSPRIEPKAGDRHDVISHFPLEHDPDESVHFAVPAPPRVPSAPAPRAAVPGAGALPPAAPRGVAVQPTAPGTPFNLPPPAPSATGHDGGRLVMPPGPAGPFLPLSTATPPLGQALLSPSVGLAALGIAPPVASPPARRAEVDVPMPQGDPKPEGQRAAAQRAALTALVDRVHEMIDLQPLAGGAPPSDALLGRIERALVEASASMGGRDRGEVDLDALLVEARRELCEHGPLTPLFDDEDVTEIQVVRHDYVIALHGRRQVPSEVGFTSEQAVGRAIRRLCLAAGKPLADGETYVERRLARGGRMFAVMPRAEDHGHMVVIRKPQRADLTLEDLVRSGTISRAMASLFAQCVAAHANILVTGAVGAGTTTLIGALAGAGSTEDRVMVLQEDDELIFNQPHTISILLGDTPAEGAQAVQAAARVRPDRLVVGEFSGAAAAELVDVMGNGVDGVIAGARAPTLRQAVLRLTADIAAVKPGLSVDVSREWLASVFDLAIEIARLRDGRHRVLRVAELGVEGGKVAIRDIFTFTVERTAAGGTIEGTFAPTGVVPGILDDLAARGVPVDPTVFRRHARSDSMAPSAEPSPRALPAPAAPDAGFTPRSPAR